VAFAAVTAAEASIDLPGTAGVILAVLGVLVVGWALGWVLEEPSAGFGAWLGLIGAGAIAYGGWEAHRSPTPMAATRPARPAAPGGSKSPGQSTASTAEATASAAEATASAAGEAPRRTPDETVEQPAAAAPPRPRSDTTEETVEQPAAGPRPGVAPGAEADTIAPRPGANPRDQPPSSPERPDAGSSEPGGV
jgi:hypothetical protein